MPRVSVLIAAYNAAAFLPDALASLQAQTCSDWEAIVVDDASPDHTLAVAQSFAQRDARIAALRLPHNQGPAGARNAALAQARAPWVAVLDADDWWDQRKLEIQLAALAARPGALWSCHGMRMVRDGKVVREVPAVPHPHLLADLLVFCHVCHSTVMMDRQAVQRVGGYDPRWRGPEDWDLWIRLAWEYGADAHLVLPQILTSYRVHGQNLTDRYEQFGRQERALFARALRRRAWGLRHPIVTLKAIDGQLDRELDRYEKAGRHGRALLYAALSVLARPQRGWRWQRGARLYRKWRGRPQ